ncbi:hypothetical protein ACFWAY_16790 [Rhodococcus sp. NPDC059968]|uniref:hypothetical protein n=1 Tax=Rhodococcus sp. NPDC059968 TaxID=3347017 RepID=UPI003671727A
MASLGFWTAGGRGDPAGVPDRARAVTAITVAGTTRAPQPAGQHIATMNITEKEVRRFSIQFVQQGR